MSVQTLCVGDRVRKVTLAGGSFGSSAAMTEGEPIECCIQLSGGSEDSSTSIANRARTAMVYFAKDPRLQVGHYLRWLSRACVPVVNEVMFRVTFVDDSECRPGQAPWMWSVSVSEDAQATELLRDVQLGT